MRMEYRDNPQDGIAHEEVSGYGMTPSELQSESGMAPSESGASLFSGATSIVSKKKQKMTKVQS